MQSHTKMKLILVSETCVSHMIFNRNCVTPISTSGFECWTFDWPSLNILVWNLLHNSFSCGSRSTRATCPFSDRITEATTVTRPVWTTSSPAWRLRRSSNHRQLWSPSPRQTNADYKKRLCAHSTSRVSWTRTRPTRHRTSTKTLQNRLHQSTDATNAETGQITAARWA